MTNLSTYYYIQQWQSSHALAFVRSSINMIVHWDVQQLFKSCYTFSKKVFHIFDAVFYWSLSYITFDQFCSANLLRSCYSISSLFIYYDWFFFAAVIQLSDIPSAPSILFVYIYYRSIAAWWRFYLKV